MHRSIPLIPLVLLASGAWGQSLDVTRGGETPDMPVASDQYTGEAFVTPRFSDRMDGMSGVVEHFAPGGRTNWHSHPAGQVLIVVSGTGWVQARGEARQTVRPGDVIWTEPDVEHWHGGTEETGMSHEAIQKAVGGSSVSWGSPVTDADLRAGD